MKPTTSFLSVTDQFCGAGGSSLGATDAGTEVVLAMNHWKLAVETHNTNFPATSHDCTDISAADPRRYRSTDILITSPECTNHSLAKGKKRGNQGQLSLFGDNQPDPAEERSRATMWDVPRFAEYHNYNVIVVENVVDARNWRLFDAWLQAMHALDYRHQIVYFNSMFAHPTPQSRDRMYVVFWKKGNKKPNLNFCPTAWCPKCEKNIESVQSWKKLSKQWGKYGPRNQYVYCCPKCTQVVQPYYYCAANAIDWSIQGERIGDRKRPLKPRTMERIQYGLEKFGKQARWVQLDHTNAEGAYSKPLTDVLPTQTTRQVAALVLPYIMSNQGDKYAVHNVMQALPTQVASVQPSLITVPPYVVELWGWSLARELDEALSTVTGSNHHGLIIPPFMFSYYGERPAVQSLDDAMVTMTTMGNHALVIPPFMTSVNHSDTRNRALDEPMPTALPQGNPALVVPPFILTMHISTQARGTEEPLTTVVAEGNHHFMVTPFLTSYYGNSTFTKMDEPVGTITTHDREGLVRPESSLSVEDCYFRMLQPHEIGRAMAFPEAYQVLGNSRDKVRQYGNAVTPPVMQMLMERCVESLQ